MTNPHPTGSDASVTEAMVEAALGAFLGAKAPDGCTIDDYLWIDPINAVELGVKLTLDENTGKPRYHWYSDIGAEEQLWARQQLLRPMVSAALTAALSLPTPKGNNDERLPCDVFVPPVMTSAPASLAGASLLPLRALLTTGDKE